MLIDSLSARPSRGLSTSSADRASSRSRSRSRNRLENRGRRASFTIPAVLEESVSSSSSSDQESSDDTSNSLSSLKSCSVKLPSPFLPPSIAVQLGIKSSYPTPTLPTEFPALPSNSIPLLTDKKDVGTPDEWLHRDENMIRLTGRHPFNSEPGLPALFDQGFLTPQSLFYVRNHGVVPQVTEQEGAEWKIEISGLVENPITLTLADLIDPAQFETVTLPITLVCAGNRRGEQNAVRQSLGFTWGPSGLSTALFTGVYLSDVLEKVRPKNVGKLGEPGFRRAEHVIFEGAEDLPKGKYGTSQKLRWARMKEKGMMLAWAMNGEALEPDHGFPLRLVVPGQIGGRSVKWLKKIEISDKESQHHLHFWDNKVLPTTLMPEQARAEKEWWYDPRYIINDLNTNSAIAFPAHDEVLTIPLAIIEEMPATYKLSGYAYAGGGHRISRVEISIDAGATWILANVNYPEDLYRSKIFKSEVWGTLDRTDRDECFCWAFWNLEIEVERLMNAGSIAVRAVDESLNMQGQSMYWNPTGMMNNWWFRVAIHKSIDPITGTIISLSFEHPTMPGTTGVGWMDRLKELGQDILNPIFSEPDPADLEILKLEKEKAVKPIIIMTKEGVNRKISMEEVKAHSSPAEPWFIVDGEVYDGTEFLKNHPGGAESITIVGGQDASEDFSAIHSPAAKAQLAGFHIGTLIPTIVIESKVEENYTPESKFLSKSKWKSAQLVKIDKVNHDSRLYKFALEHPDQDLGLPTGQHVYCRLRRKVGAGDQESGAEIIQGELIQRAYTPVSSKHAKGHVELLIKVYKRTDAFPEGGKMTLGFEELNLGDKIEFKGPLGSFEWMGKGIANWRGIQRKPKTVAMICAGSGITPIIQVLRGIIHDVEDAETKLWLINSNKTEDDILLRQELQDLSNHVGPDRFQHHYCLSKAPEDWQHSTGRIDLEMMKNHLPSPSEDALVLFCGPDAMVEMVVKPGMESLGWNVEKSLVVF